MPWKVRHVNIRARMITELDGKWQGNGMMMKNLWLKFVLVKFTSAPYVVATTFPHTHTHTFMCVCRFGFWLCSYFIFTQNWTQVARMLLCNKILKECWRESHIFHFALNCWSSSLNMFYFSRNHYAQVHVVGPPFEKMLPVLKYHVKNN